MPIDRVINFDDPASVGTLYQEIATLKGWQQVRVNRKVRKATWEQFKWYYGCILPRMKAWISETQGGNEEGDDLSDEEADNFLKREFCGKEMHNPATGEYMGKTTPLKRYWDIRTMVEFVEDVLTLARQNGIKIPPPDRDWKNAKASVMASAAQTRRAG